MVWVVVTVGSVIAGLIQTVGGFGSVVFLMMVLPFYFDMVDAPALALVINQLFCMALCWRYRRYINWRLTLPPALVYAAVSVVVIQLTKGLDTRVLAMVFGAFLLLLSLYFLLVAKRLKLKPRPAAGVACGVLSGVTAGLFAIGGPPMALYFSAATDDHRSYLACMQLLFSITGIAGVGGRLISGQIHREILPYAAAGAVCILVGAWLGGKLTDKLNADKLCRIVYIFVGVSGAVLLLQQL